MKRFIISLLTLYIWAVGSHAQNSEFNPTSPGDPQPFYVLQVQVSPEAGGTANVTRTMVEAGQRIYLNVSSNTNFQFRQWVCGDEVLSTSSSFYYTMPAQNVTITAQMLYYQEEFNPTSPGDPEGQGEVIPQHLVTIYTSPSMGGYTSQSTFYLQEGQTQKVYAYNNSNYDFVGWYKDGQLESMGNPLTITMADNDIVLTARFQFNPGSPSDPPSEVPDPNNDVHVYIVPTTLFSNWTANNTIQIKLTDVAGKTVTYDMAQGDKSLYVASFNSPKKEVTSIIFVQNDNSGNPIEQIEALDGAQLYNGEWRECVFSRLGTLGYWIPVPSKEVSVAEGVVIYYDNSVTQWENVYLRVGRNMAHGYSSDWSQSLLMTHAENTNVWYVYIDSSLEELEYWMLTDSNGESGVGKSFYALPANANILQPSTRSITSDTWISVGDHIVPQTYLLWNSRTFYYQSYISQQYAIRNIPDTLHEGDNAQIEVYSSIPYNSERTFQLLPVNKDNRLQITPKKLTMPAMSTSALFELSVLDDAEPQELTPVGFYLYENTAGYFLSKDTIWIVDNDVPAISLKLSQSSIEEGAGLRSFTATVKRLTMLDGEVIVYLSDNSQGRIYYDNQYVTLRSGETEATVQLGIIEDSQAQGEQTIEISAAVYMPSCRCTVKETSDGYDRQPLTITDNDSPALTLQISTNMLLEGEEEAALLTVIRNTPVDTALTVAISVDNAEGLVFPATVVIPQGASSATARISVVRNENSEDSHSVSFSAMHEGFVPGACYAMVVDQTLPDAVVELVNNGKDSMEVNQEVKLLLKVKNQGAAGLAKGVSVNLYVSGFQSPALTLTLPASIPIGSEHVFDTIVKLPSLVGTYTYYAIVNEDRQVKELLSYNNTSQHIQIVALPPFSVTTFETDKPSYMPDDTVRIMGHVQGSLSANTDVEIYVYNQGWRTTFTVKTEENGDFHADFIPQPGQSGLFEMGACYPSENVSRVMAQVKFYGLEISRQPVTCEIVNGDVYEGKILVRNIGALPLHNVTATSDGSETDCTISFGKIETISPNEELPVTFSLLCNTPTEGTQWRKIPVKVSSDELLEGNSTLYYFCRNPQGQLVCSEQEIRTNIAARDTSLITFYLSNTGLGETGNITLELPDWIQSVTSKQIPSIPAGEYVQVVLRTIPNDMFERSLNAAITGQIGFNPTNCEGFALPFTVTPVSSQFGTLRVDVRDENTYYTEQGPHVKDAQVVIKNVSTGAVINQGLTNEQGIYEIELTEGYYGISVSADDHDAYSNNLFVQPENVTDVVVNLSIRAIEITWTVEETEIEDSYQIVTTVKFETQVPKPVVVVEAPSKIDGDLLQEGESLMYTVKVTNEGLIRAEDVTITLPDGGADFVFEALAYQNPFILEAKQSVEIPVKVTRMSKSNYAPSRNAKYHGIIECNGNMLTLYYWDCGTDRKWHQYGVPIQYAPCDAFERFASSVNISGGGQGGPGWRIWLPPIQPVTGPNRPNNNPYESTENPPVILSGSDVGCEPCQNQFLTKLVNCGMSFIPGLGDILGFIGLMNECTKDGITLAHHPEQAFDLIKHCGGQLVEFIAGLNPIGSLILCFKDFSLPCEHTADNAASAPQRRVMAEENTENDYTDDPEYLARFKKRTLIAVEALTNYQNYMALFVSPEIQEYISNAENADLFYAWDLVLKGELDENVLNSYRPVALPDEMWIQLLERMRNTYEYMNGNTAITSNFVDPEEAVNYLQGINECAVTAETLGYASLSEMFEYEYNLLNERLNNKSASVCATISLQFEQKMTMTRQAFRGTLSVFNGHEKTAMTNIHLKLDVYDEYGRKATDKEFQISLENLDGMTGDLQLETENGWTINAQETGVATILFIPTKFAAPTQDMLYSFGGELTYTDPFTGLTVTRQLFPVQLTVSPSPQLELTYFMQRDVFSDDPLTESIVEPAQPTEFALLINNIGYGDAKNVNMSTKEPQIVDNEKGLLIDFRLLYSLLNGKEKSLPIDEQIATEFGTIPSQSQMYAQWFFESTLIGHFVEYDVAYTHLTSYDNPNLSLIDTVSIHEMIRSVSVPATNPSLLGWLVNDKADAADMPDALYLSDGSVQNLNILNTMQIEPVDAKKCIVTCTPGVGGWNYGVAETPMYSWRNVTKVTRLSDGADISLHNVWQTPCILRDGADPVNINRLHIADNIESTTSYRVEFSEKLVHNKADIYRLSYMVDGVEYAYDSLEYYTPITLLPEPVKEGYTFSGWQNVISIMPAHNDTIFGTFTINQHMVTFHNYDGAELQSDKLDYGTMPAYRGTTPTKPTTAQYTYTFKGWHPEVVSVVGDAVYTADYDSVVNQYTVTFLDENGAVLLAREWAYGEIPVCEPPVKEGTEELVYRFKGWNPEVQSVTGEAVYQATFMAVRLHTLVFLDWNGDLIDVVKSAEDEEVIAPTNPIRDGYDFAGWSRDLTSVTTNMYVIALYKLVSTEANIIYKNQYNQIIAFESVEFSLPVLQETGFVGWVVEEGNIEDGIVIRSLFNEIPASTQVSSTDNSEPKVTKILRDYQILILRGDYIYTLTGQKVR